MSRITLFDANCSLGHSGTRVGPVTAPQLEEALDRVGITQALVTHSHAVEYDPSEGNALLGRELAGHPRLQGCWVVMPPFTGEMPEPQALVEELISSGARAARLYPKRVGPLREWVYGGLFGALEARRVPLLVDFELAHWGGHMQGIDWDGLDWALSSYPQLPVVLLRVGQAVDRMLLPFLDRHPNLYLEMSYYIGSGALERTAGRVGAERLVFGTGQPQYAPGPAITLLTYSGLSQEDKEKVGAGNLQRLLGQVRN